MCGAPPGPSFLLPPGMFLAASALPLQPPLFHGSGLPAELGFLGSGGVQATPGLRKGSLACGLVLSGSRRQLKTLGPMLQAEAVLRVWRACRARLQAEKRAQGLLSPRPQDGTRVCVCHLAGGFQRTQLSSGSPAVRTGPGSLPDGRPWAGLSLGQRGRETRNLGRGSWRGTQGVPAWSPRPSAWSCLALLPSPCFSTGFQSPVTGHQTLPTGSAPPAAQGTWPLSSRAFQVFFFFP